VGKTGRNRQKLLESQMDYYKNDNFTLERSRGTEPRQQNDGEEKRMPTEKSIKSEKADTITEIPSKKTHSYPVIPQTPQEEHREIHSPLNNQRSNSVMLGMYTTDQSFTEGDGYDQSSEATKN
jgi:hypothetical protein